MIETNPQHLNKLYHSSWRGTLKTTTFIIRGDRIGGTINEKKICKNNWSIDDVLHSGNADSVFRGAKWLKNNYVGRVRKLAEVVRGAGASNP